jgi:hypothetical protein
VRTVAVTQAVLQAIDERRSVEVGSAHNSYGRMT